MPTKKAPVKKTTKKATTKTVAKKVASKKKSPAKKPATKKAVAKKVVKKAPAKKAVKKATTKTATKKAATKTKKGAAMKKPVKDLMYASDQESFWVQNGEILNSLLALRDALEEMDKEIYQYHATGGQNDFSIWVETVLCDDACAASLAKAKTPKSAKTAVVKHLKLYSI